MKNQLAVSRLSGALLTGVGHTANLTFALAFTSGKPHKVVFREEVSFGAVCSRSTGRRQRFASQCVFTGGNRSHVERIATPACSVVADVMIQLHSFGDWSDLALVPHTIEETHSTFYPNPAVASIVPTSPDVATVGFSNPARRVFALRPRNEQTNHRAKITHSCFPSERRK